MATQDWYRFAALASDKISALQTHSSKYSSNNFGTSLWWWLISSTMLSTTTSRQIYQAADTHFLRCSPNSSSRIREYDVSACHVGMIVFLTPPESSSRRGSWDYSQHPIERFPRFRTVTYINRCSPALLAIAPFRGRGRSAGTPIVECVKCSNTFQHSQIAISTMSWLELPTKHKIPGVLHYVCPNCGHSAISSIRPYVWAYGFRRQIYHETFLLSILKIFIISLTNSTSFLGTCSFAACSHSLRQRFHFRQSSSSPPGCRSVSRRTRPSRLTTGQRW